MFESGRTYRASVASWALDQVLPGQRPIFRSRWGSSGSTFSVRLLIWPTDREGRLEPERLRWQVDSNRFTVANWTLTRSRFEWLAAHFEVWPADEHDLVIRCLDSMRLDINPARENLLCRVLRHEIHGPGLLRALRAPM